ncbi:MAG: glycosyltransferase [Christensenellaceae bacterium]|nr:glycosyltransferase [Christensenellaceae bacterium]
MVIPSLHPDEKLIRYVDDLINNNISKILVVDDGSGEEYSSFFEKIKKDNVTVLTHETNLGKGAALKTAFNHIQNSLKEYEIIITADSDGQHSVRDVIKVAKSVHQNKDSLVLGTRDFNQEHVPFKSKNGNKITTFVYKLLYGKYVPDTQTGLRGFNKKYLKNMNEIKGDRFEYEMNMLIYFSLNNFPLEFVEIETIYENNNTGSHFKPFRDSFKIYKVIFSNFFKFIASSLFTTGVDFLVYALLITTLENTGIGKVTYISISSYTARLVSSIVNYTINHKYVFSMTSSNVSKKQSLIKYAITCLLIISLSNLSTIFINKFLNINELIAKPISDVVLFVLSYFIQRNWVFANKKN